MQDTDVSGEAEDVQIVGSAEPLSPGDTETRLRELEVWGVDLSLVWASLQRTPTERVSTMLAALELVEALQHGFEKLNRPRADTA